MKKLVLFTNSYPYGPGETFLHEELPFLAAKFSQIVIYPLYIPNTSPDRSNSKKPLSGSIIVKDALLPFDHKDKMRLLVNGLFNLGPLSFGFKEFFSRRVLVCPRNIWIFFNYLLILRSILSNKKIMNKIKSDLFEKEDGDNLSGREKGNKIVAYFYWGDKSALIIPFLRRWFKKKCSNVVGGKAADLILEPEYVVRFHGSDLYEYAKGYLPFRKMLYKSVDYAVTISQSGADYINKNYAECLPEHICVYRLGSCNPFAADGNDGLPILSESIKSVENKGRSFRILSCSNVIELKRLDLIVEALKELGKELDTVLELAQGGLAEICWTHIGGGPLLEEIEEQCKALPSYIKTEFKGVISHNEVLDYYHNSGAELFIQVSRSEGVPVSIMEAISFGIPVAATNVGGVSEIVNENTGTLLPADLTPQLLKKVILNHMQKTPQEYKKLRSSAIAEWQQNWNAEFNYKKFADFISNL